VRLAVITKGIWTLVAPVQGDTTAVEAWLSELPDNLSGSAAGMMVLMDESAARPQGPRSFSVKLVHEIDKKESIWEFIKGDLRVLWFFGNGNKIIVCSHGFIKGGDKTPNAQKNEAIKLKRDYFEAMNNADIEIVEIDK